MHSAFLGASITIDVDEEPAQSFRFSVDEMDDDKSAIIIGAFNKVNKKWSFDPVGRLTNGSTPESEDLAAELKMCVPPPPTYTPRVV